MTRSQASRTEASASAAGDGAPAAPEYLPDRLRVPAASGPVITVAVAGGPPVRFEVGADGVIAVDPDDASLRVGSFSTIESLLRSIPGAERVEA